MTISQEGGTDVTLNRTHLVIDRYTEKAKDDRNTGEWTDTTKDAYFSWLLPQIPIYGTFFLYGRSSTDTWNKGKYTFNLKVSKKNPKN